MRIKIKINAAQNDNRLGSVLDRSGKGINRTISMSKIIKIIPRRKNRNENGIRAVFLGSNPHSNGEDFSRSLRDRVLRIHAAPKVASAKVEAINEDEIMEIID